MVGTALKAFALETTLKVVFANPPVTPHKKIMRDFDCAGESKSNYLYQPYDLLLLSSFIPDHWEFTFIDSVADQIEHDRFDKILKSINPDIIVCPVAGMNWNEDKQTLIRLRKTFPDAILLTFGDLFIELSARFEIKEQVNGILSSPLMFRFEQFEQKNKNLASTELQGLGLHSFDDKVVTNLKAPVVINFPMPKHEYFQRANYRWPFNRYKRYTTVFFTWGCPYSCSYCILSKFPNYWRTAEEIISEMRFIKKLGYQEVYIGDKSFGVSKEVTLKTLKAMIAEKLNLSWSTYFHPTQYSPELLELMASAGCHTIVIGIESVNIVSLKNYGRHINQNQLYDLIEHAKRLNIDICGDFILGLPNEDRNTILATIKFACDLKIDFASFNLATPLPGSSLKSLAVEKKIIENNDQGFDSSGNNLITSFANVSNRELSFLHKYAVLRFYCRPSYLLKRLKSVSGPEHLQIQFAEAIQLLISSLGFRRLLRKSK